MEVPWVENPDERKWYNYEYNACRCIIAQIEYQLAAPEDLPKPTYKAIKGCLNILTKRLERIEHDYQNRTTTNPRG